MKTSNYIIFVVGFLLLSIQLKGQIALQLTQYAEVLPLYNPAFSGVENHTDLRFGLRRQWSGIANSPFSNYVHVSGVLPHISKKKRRKTRYKSPYDVNKMTDLVDQPNNGLRISNPNLQRKLVRDSILRAVRKLDRKARLKLRRQLQPKKRVLSQSKHGYSTTIIADEQGAFTNLSFNGGYAYHLPISEDAIVSFGISATINNANFDRNKARVSDEFDDPLYQLYASGELNRYSLYLNPGIAIYSSSFYISYGINRVLGNGLGSGQVLGIDGVETQHNLMAATYINVSADFLLSPGILFSYKALSPSAFYATTKIYYKEKIWLGLNYRNQDAVGGSFGFFFSDKYKLSYAYDVPVAKLNNSFGSTHEIVFGILLKKGSAPKPLIF